MARVFPIALLILGACTANEAVDDPVAAVPSDVRKVTVLNLNKISKANGAPILASSGQMSPEGTESTGMFIPASLMKPLDAMITAAPGASDTSRAVMFTTRKGYTGLILKINDPETVEQTLSRQLQPAEEIEDCETYTTGRGIIALRGNICVIAPDAATIKEITDSRSPQWRISKMEGVRQFLSTDNAILTALPAENLYGDKMKGEWMCVAVRFNDTSAIADIMFMHPDGKLDSIGSRIAGRIDPDILRFIPQNANIAAATGVQGTDGKAFGFEQLMSKYYPDKLRLSETGTTAWYGRCFSDPGEDDLFSAASWNLASLTQMDAVRADSVTQSIETYYGTSGTSQGDSPMRTIDIDNLSLSFGYIGGYYAESLNGPVTDGNSNPYTQDFQGAHMVVLVDVPQGSALQRAAMLPCGASFAMRLTSTRLHAKLTFYGNQKPFLATLNSIDLLRPLLPYLINAGN